MRVMELHAPLKIVQRSQGRTATAAAAYRTATRIECERTGEVHDYTRRQRGVEATELLLPDDAPDWDRARLWNEAELREKHPRAQPAREIEVAFPAEFNQAQRREAGLAIGRLFRDRYRVAVDIAWHLPSRKGDQRNHHAHLLYTARPFENGTWAKKKQTPLDDRTPVTVDGEYSTRGAEEVRSLRQAVAGVLNTIAARDDLKVFVEHLSFCERGLDKEATQHMGPVASEMERRGEETDIGNHNRGVQARNAEREELEEQRSNIVIFPGAKQRPRSPYERFYIESQARRQEMVAQLDARFAAQEAESNRKLQELKNARQSRHLVARLWTHVTGRERAERRELLSLGETLRQAAEARAAAESQFEHDRIERLEALKSEIAQQEARIKEWALHNETERAARETARPDAHTDLNSGDPKDARRAAYVARASAPMSGPSERAGPSEA